LPRIGWGFSAACSSSGTLQNPARARLTLIQRAIVWEFPSVAFWNWSQPSTDWFNLATGEALAEYNPSPAMRELVAGVESQGAPTLV
jgi:hypothetical protein